MQNFSTLFLIFLSSFIISLGLIYIFKALFYKINILDNPKKYWLKRKPIPYSMWIVFFLSFFAISLIFVEHNYKLFLIWIFGFVITLISFFDDLLDLSPKIRLAIQILIWAVIWITSIKIGYVSNIFWWIINLETYFFEIFNFKIYLIPLFFTIFWYVFVFNSLNWSDWIQGNTSGISAISFFYTLFTWNYFILKR